MTTPVTGWRRWSTLVVLAVAVSLIVIDGTIINVALPTIIRDLQLGFTGAQWTGALYALIFAALLLGSGWLGDRVGRRTTLLVGVVLFGVASIVAAAAGSAGPFLAARAVQGVGAALVLPSTLSTVNATYTGKDRTIAFGIWGATISAMAAVGPLLGGWLTTAVSWRWVFWINVPLGLAIVAGALAFVPNTRGRATGGFDALGFALSAVGLGALVFGLIQGQAYGWWRPVRELSLGPLTWRADWPLAAAPVAIAVGIVATAAFVLWERSRAARGAEPLLDMSLFGHRSFAVGNATAGIIAFGEFGLLFVLPLYLQNALGFSSLKSGWVLAAMAAGAMAAGGAARHIAEALSAARVAQIGVALEATALAALALLVRPDTPAWLVAAVLVVYGVGLGLCSAQLTSVILVDVPRAQSGQGSATQSTVRQVGSALGVAALSTTLAQSLEHGARHSLDGLLPAAQGAQLETSLADTAGGVLHALRSGALPLPAGVTDQVVARLLTVFTDATRTTMLLGAAALGMAFLISLALPGRTSPRDGAAQLPSDAAARR